MLPTLTWVQIVEPLTSQHRLNDALARTAANRWLNRIVAFFSNYFFQFFSIHHDARAQSLFLLVVNLACTTFGF